MIVCVLLQSYNEETAVPVLETIFSPAFHMSKSAGGEIASGGRLGNTCTFLFPSSNAIMFLCLSTPKKLFSAILCIYLSHLSSLPFPFQPTSSKFSGMETRNFIRIVKLSIHMLIL